MTVSKSKQLVSWEEFNAMTYADAKELITGNMYHELSISSFLEYNGFPITKTGDKGMYESYTQLWTLEHSPLGQALK